MESEKSKEPIKGMLNMARMQEAIQLTGYNVVTCPECGNVIICHSQNSNLVDFVMSCPHPGCDCYTGLDEYPDLFYDGWEKGVEVIGQDTKAELVSPHPNVAVLPVALRLALKKKRESEHEVIKLLEEYFG